MATMESYCTREQCDSDPFALLAEVPRGEPVALLTSNGAGPTWLFRGPRAVLQIEATDVGDAFARLSSWFTAHPGLRHVGWFGYDLRDAVEPVPRTIAAKNEPPLVHLAAHADALAWASVPPPVPMPIAGVGPVRALLARAEYERLVATVVEHIRAGDLFQANLCQPFVAPYDGDPRRLFARLCALSPAPFAAYVEDGRGTAVLSSSPEEFLWRDGDTVRTRPIKGTRPRGGDPASDARLLAELLASEKDKAELAMIVDLMRNDFGKLAVPGSVRVGPFPEHASFAQVHHLFATVTARLRPGVDACELLRATFPAGSITGAPKLRAMEVLEALELRRRGVYTGALGWVGPGARLHLNVAIRTLVVRDGEIRFFAGGGVTARSDAAQEYDETLHKARGMLAALGVALEVPR